MLESLVSEHISEMESGLARSSRNFVLETGQRLRLVDIGELGLQLLALMQRGAEPEEKLFLEIADGFENSCSLRVGLFSPGIMRAERTVKVVLEDDPQTFGDMPNVEIDLPPKLFWDEWGRDFRLNNLFEMYLTKFLDASDAVRRLYRSSQLFPEEVKERFETLLNVLYGSVLDVASEVRDRFVTEVEVENTSVKCNKTEVSLSSVVRAIAWKFGKFHFLKHHRSHAYRDLQEDEVKAMKMGREYNRTVALHGLIPEANEGLKKTLSNLNFRERVDKRFRRRVRRKNPKRVPKALSTVAFVGSDADASRLLERVGQMRDNIVLFTQDHVTFHVLKKNGEVVPTSSPLYNVKKIDGETMFSWNPFVTTLAQKIEPRLFAEENLSVLKMLRQLPSPSVDEEVEERFDVERN